MSAATARPARRAIGPTVPLLAVAALAVAYGSSLPIAASLLIAAAGVAAGVALRALGPPGAREVFPIPVLLAFGALSAVTVVGPLPILLAGLAGVAFVAWLLDDPDRPPAGAVRGAVVWAVPALGVGLAWSSSYVLPPTAATLGVASGLAAAALIVLAILVSRPALFDRDPTQTL